MTSFTTRSDPYSGTLRGQIRFMDTDEIEREVRDIGHNLWRDMLPAEFRELYAVERASWNEQSLLIVSDEPHLPWELVWPYHPGDWKDEAPWCANYRVTRWLRRDGRGNGNEGPPAELKLRNLAIVTPVDSELPGAQRERQVLTDLLARHGLTDLSPPKATRQALLRLLEEGGYDGIHVGCHGNFYPEHPTSESALWLEGNVALTPNSIVGPEIEGYIKKNRPAFVLNSCEAGRQSWGLTRLAGWAQRLLSAGAGLFIGPLWEVSDEGALAFMKTFYEQLLDGATVGTAGHEARLAAKEKGDPTWLAYTIYGHPNGRLARRQMAPLCHSEAVR
jgi:hypothetical protein